MVCPVFVERSLCWMQSLLDAVFVERSLCWMQSLLNVMFEKRACARNGTRKNGIMKTGAEKRGATGAGKRRTIPVFPRVLSPMLCFIGIEEQDNWAKT